MKTIDKWIFKLILAIFALNLLSCSSEAIEENANAQEEEAIKELNATAKPSEFAVGEVKVSAPHDIWTDITIPSRVEGRVTELGLLYGEDQNLFLPFSSSVKQDGLQSTYKYRVTGLKANTNYYFKPYAITKTGIVYYGDVFQYATREQGNFTWSFNGTLDPNDENHQRIKQAFDTATWYYSNYTSIHKHVTVNYSPGTQTADANFDGWINVGSNPSYQRTGTALHEMAHTVGVGTHWTWKFIIDDDDSYYSSANADAVVSMMSDGEFPQIYGDGWHFWPYGINGAHEDSGDDFLYILNSLIVQGFKDDGLPSN